MVERSHAVAADGDSEVGFNAGYTYELAVGAVDDYFAGEESGHGFSGNEGDGIFFMGIGLCILNYICIFTV